MSKNVNACVSKRTHIGILWCVVFADVKIDKDMHAKPECVNLSCDIEGGAWKSFCLYRLLLPVLILHWLCRFLGLYTRYEKEMQKAKFFPS